MDRGWSDPGPAFVGERHAAALDDSSAWASFVEGDDADLLDSLISASLARRAVVLAADGGVVKIIKTYGVPIGWCTDLQGVWDAVLDAPGPVALEDVGVGARVEVSGKTLGVVVLPCEMSQDSVRRTGVDARLIAGVIGRLAERFAFRAERDMANRQCDQAVERLRALIATDLDGVAYLDARGVVRYANDRFVDLLGTSHDEISVGQVFDHLLPVHREMAVSMLDLSSQGVAERYTGDFRRPDGEVRWVEVEVNPIRAGDSGSVGSWVVVTDRTEEKRSADAVLASERRLRSLVEQAADYIAVLSGDGTIRYLSPSAERHLGTLSENVVGLNAFAFIHPEDVERVKQEFAELILVPGGQARTSYRGITPDGRWRHSEVVATNLLDDPAVGGVVVNSRDVTESLQFERFVVGQAEVLEMAISGAPLSDSLGAVAAMLEEALEGAFCQICLVSPDSGTLSTLAAPSLSPSFCDAVESLAESWSMEQWSVPHSIVMADHEVWSRLLDVPGGPNLVRCDVVPLSGGSTGVRGVLFVHRATPPSISNAEDPRALERLCSLSQVVIQRTLAEEALAHQSTHDPLTGLANRHLLFERMEHALARARRKPSMLAILFLDVDRFKLVNDSLGHAAGDLVLRELAHRLTRAVRPFDVMARFGGDEFVVVCEDLGHPAEATVIAERIAEALRPPMTLAGREYFLDVSVGIALDSGGTSSPEALLRDADTAMYRAKDRGGNCHEVFDRALRRQVRERLDVEAGLRRALDRDELFVVYQPVVCLPSAQVAGFEALVRWAHPDRGLHLPDRFIPLAEETGLIGAIGAHVLEVACMQAASWERRCGDSRGPWVSVNLSPRQLEDSAIVQTVARALERSGMDPSLLCLEITESAVMDDSPATARTLQSLHRLGLRLAIDDFGAGYSSLGQLKQLPVDVIKIDRSLVAGLGTESGDGAIVGAVITMAEALGIDVVVEGVENPDQVAALLDLGCPNAQGFFYGVPTPAEMLAGIPVAAGDPSGG